MARQMRVFLRHFELPLLPRPEDRDLSNHMNRAPQLVAAACSGRAHAACGPTRHQLGNAAGRTSRAGRPSRVPEPLTRRD